MNNDLMFSSSTGEWGTPKDFWDALNREFHFQVDLAASSANAKCERFFSVEYSLMDHWRDVGKGQACWLNPIYGRGIAPMLSAAAELHHSGNTVVCLPPARTDTAWWHDIVMKCADEIWLLRGRLRFELPDGSTTDPAPFPSAIVVMRPRLPHDHRAPIFRSVQPSHYIARHTPIPPNPYTDEDQDDNETGGE